MSVVDEVPLVVGGVACVSGLVPDGEDEPGSVDGMVCGMDWGVVAWPGVPGWRVMLVCAMALLATNVAASARTSFIVFLPCPMGTHRAHGPITRSDCC